MGDFISSKTVATRKEHKCFTCCRNMPKGSTMLASTNKEDGQIYTLYICQTCVDVIHEFPHFEGSEWLYEHETIREALAPGQTPEQLLEDLRNSKPSLNS
ncbi:hypothetical protein DYBT9275_02746 [Dyadobacter sp. CECT 9275]|uniref:Uncharacterized protein n=1 Tax=Dyadobacter helix TaxID=2822344 RepID=A0A916JG96_9BACT|nr:hypothetical protein DYBT9275_02746 [Dyadobacter sp. CECT 9275]